MSPIDNRSEPRKRVCLQAFASDVNDTFDVKFIIRDVSKGGCMIVSSQVHELPDLIQLVPEGFDKPLAGKIVWRGDKFAGICFMASNDEAILKEVREYFLGVMSDLDDDEVLNLNGFVRPLGYHDRLARTAPRPR